ncbi:(2Fe-2S)-binding protein [Candidatus Halobonum tyrrellensis]|uniref:(2Fe-2S)-binding domain-containing protein n=1 Tax=Candidatus Halobonum tyrrellensis G22 TaxID=1324957 RepID=V4IUR9_9EURY|nr:(2Fe-2S)-binding protein [Candidatus Halobonum tyrrellensis]ESP86942.1 (2Fe-2S)-binding domain-containing protein [Candidatus Halobonum tyrrellensis G22]
MGTHDITLTVNGEEEALTVESRTLLVHALREGVGDTAPKVGCESGKCGACTVHLDGEAVKSCMVLAAAADGGEVTTVSGLGGASGEGEGTAELDAVQTAFHEEHGLQCGYCTPGMVMTVEDLLAERPDPSEAEIRHQLKGNICRCTGYQNVVRAVETAADRLSEDPEAELGADAADADGGTASEVSD